MKSIMQAGLVDSEVEKQFAEFPEELQDLEKWKAFEAYLLTHAGGAVRVLALLLIGQRQEIRILKKRLSSIENPPKCSDGSAKPKTWGGPGASRGPADVPNTAGGRLPPPENQ